MTKDLHGGRLTLPWDYLWLARDSGGIRWARPQTDSKLIQEDSTAAKSLLRFALVVLFAVDIGMVFQGFQVSDNFGRHP